MNNNPDFQRGYDATSAGREAAGAMAGLDREGRILAIYTMLTYLYGDETSDEMDAGLTEYDEAGDRYMELYEARWDQENAEIEEE